MNSRLLNHTVGSSTKTSKVNMNDELLESLHKVFSLLKPHQEKILSINIDSNRISVHVDGFTFNTIRKQYNVVVEGSFGDTGYHCGFQMPELPIHIHTLLQ